MLADKLKIVHEFYYYVDLKRASHFKGVGFGLIAEEHVFANFIASTRRVVDGPTLPSYMYNIHVLYIILYVAAIYIWLVSGKHSIIIIYYNTHTVAFIQNTFC